MATDLFGNTLPDNQPGSTSTAANKKAVNGYNLLIALYGTVEGKRCKHCPHLVRRSFAKNYYKCSKIDKHVSGNPSTDHRVNWAACGLINQP